MISFTKRVTFPTSRNASVSSKINMGDFEARESEYWSARDAIDLSPPESCSKSYTNLLVGGVGVK